MKTSKLNIKKVLLVISVVLLISTPIINNIVNIFVRNSGGMGSECLLWIFPILGLAAIESQKENQDI